MADSKIRTGQHQGGTGAAMAAGQRRNDQSTGVTASVPEAAHADHSVSSSTENNLPDHHISNASQITYTPPSSVSPEYNAHHTFTTLVSRNSSPVDLLRALANQTSSSPFSRSRIEHEQNDHKLLHAQIARMSDSQRAEVARRLQSPEMEALHQATREGVGMINIRDREHTTMVLNGIASNLSFIRRELGIDRPTQPLSEKQVANARTTLTGFVEDLEKNLVSIRTHLDHQEIARVNDAWKRPCREFEIAGKVDKRVCSAYEKDVLRSSHILEHEDGSRAWVLSLTDMSDVWYSEGADGRKNKDQALRLAAERLDGFTGGNQAQTMALSRVMNQASLAYGVLEHLTMTEGRNLPVPNHVRFDYYPAYLCRRNKDGTLEVKAKVFGEVSAANAVLQDDASSFRYFNPQTSSYEGTVTFRIDKHGDEMVTDASYKLQMAPYEGFDSRNMSIKVKGHSSADQLENMLKLDEMFSIPIESEILMTGGVRELSNWLAEAGVEGFKDRIAKLEQANQLTKDHRAHFEARISAISGIREQLVVMQDQKDVPDLSTARNALTDLRNMAVEDLNGSWKPGADVEPQMRDAIISAQAACTRLCEETMRDYEAFLAEADEQNYGLDAGVGADVTAALHSRANHCAMQARAINKLMHNFYNEVVDIGRQNSNPGLQAEDEAAKLLAESANRMIRIRAALEDYHNLDGPLPEFGRGVSDAEYQSLKKGIIKSLRDGGELPLSHPKLSEAQLMQARIEHFLDQHPGCSEVMRPHMERYTAMLAREIAAGDWSEVRGSFNDIGGDGRRRQLTNILTPGPSMADPAIRSTYGGLGVSHHDHEQTSHAANLAHSQLNNSRGQRLFSGLRHASLASKMSRSDFLGASRDRKELFVRELLDDQRFRSLVTQNDCRTMDEMVELLGSPEHSGEIHSWLREAGTRNAAVDLVSSAVATNPYLRDEALRNGVVFLTLDSVSMLAPSDSEAGRRNGAFQIEQEAALSGLGEEPVKIKLTGPDGVQREVDVVLFPRQFNFSVKPRSWLERFLRRIFGGATDWQAMDAKNNASLTDMLGDLSSDELGGEVGRILRYLRTGSDEVLSPAQKAFLDDPDSPYHENRADLIEELAGQVKELYNSGSHRNPSSDPHKLVSRIAMLSHMLGHSPAYNCGNGLSRTGGMDVDTKLLAASMAADGRVPSPDTPPDQLRRMHFELNTGQLAMNEKSTGVRRFYERLRSGRMAPGRNDGAARTALRNHFNSPLVRSLYLN